MAAKSKKRLSKIENKLLKLDKLQLNDVICSICQSILIEPVTLPCFHDFCQGCFNGSIENNALCCPLCRLRIGSWLRTTTKQNNTVNAGLWDFIKAKFQKEIDVKLKGGDIELPEEKITLRLSAPGEIRSEYEAEIERLRAERLQVEQKHQKETDLLIKKLQEEEEEAHKKYMERLKQDEILAKQLQKTNKNTTNANRSIVTNTVVNSKMKTKPIENYFCKNNLPVAAKDTIILTDDNSSVESSTPQAATVKTNSRASPEMVPSYTRYLKNFIDKKLKNVSGIWNKENGRSVSKVISSEIETSKEVEVEPPVKPKPNKTVHSLPVSLPYTGILLQHKKNRNNCRKETGSADSMRQELCYFKPIDCITPMSVKPGSELPLRVPCKRGLAATPLEPAPEPSPAPTRDDYLNSLCRLRHVSLAQRLPSAFVIALNLLRVNTMQNPTRSLIRTKASLKKYTPSPVFPTTKKSTPIKNQQASQVEGITKLDSKKTLRRTRSMGSIPKSVTETTPKKSKNKERKVSSERKHYLRSDSKKYNATLSLNSPPLIPEPITNDKINLGVKNLSSTLENCDVKKILDEQLRIERLIEQEKNDLEMAMKMDAELNRRPLRRTAVKRQVAINYALRPTKKLKV